MKDGISPYNMDNVEPVYLPQHAWILKAITNVIRMAPTNLVSPSPLHNCKTRSRTTPAYRKENAQRHIAMEIAIVLQEGILEINGKRHFLCPPEVAILPPFTWHREGAIHAKAPYSCLWLNGGDEVLTVIVSRYRPAHGWDEPLIKYLSGPNVQRLLYPLESLEAVVSLHKDKLAFESFRAYLLAVLSELQCLCITAHDIPHSDNTLNKYTFEHVRRFLKGNLHRAITVSEIAHIAQLSPCYLNRLFHEQHGEPIHSFLHRLRMEKAMKLLLGTNMKIKEIAEQVGFTDPLYFSRRFRRRFGYAPSQVVRNY